MREEIIAGLNEPARLEKLYRKNKTLFRDEFNLIYEDISRAILPGYGTSG